MTTNTNQPDRGNPGGASRTGAHDAGNQGQQQGNKQGQQGQRERDENARSASAAGSPGGRQGNEDATRFLDAIEENVGKLRTAMGGSERSGRSEEREGRQGRETSRGAEDEDRDEASRGL